VHGHNCCGEMLQVKEGPAPTEESCDKGEQGTHLCQGTGEGLLLTWRASSMASSCLAP
jgi:hypothetical protein